MTSTRKDEPELLQAFLEARLKQAESDVMNYSMMLDELRKLMQNESRALKNAQFLTLFTNQEKK